MALLQVSCFLAVAIAAVSAALPDYVPVCPRNDPDINACVSNAIEKLRPALMKGIPELEVPPIDPLEVSEVTVSPIPGQRVRVTASNIKVYGLEKTRINRINVNVRNQEFSGAVEMPNLMFAADYNVDAKFMQLSMKGKGAVSGNATGVHGDFTLRGKLVKRKNGNYLQFNKLNLNFNVDRSHSHMEGLVSGDLVIGDDTYDQGDNGMNIWPLAKPVIERSIAEVLLEMANRIVSHVSYDEMFP
ncbi:uncharacterized protein LOC126457271 [Schistocerca serialis cubense]|uniref:uncharacterized protein LOC126457271 n=1 Tax=Schistocerca serialis cubense TaxID=2023355 RepID=UPI00214F3D3B|nr:uncharacterized protein LOC126457271 [Schistocerca serialis cubense]